MSRIIALLPKKCADFGGAFSVWQGVGSLEGSDDRPLAVAQVHERFTPSSETRLVISFGVPPPKGPFKRAFVFCSPLMQAELAGELPLLRMYVEQVQRGLLDYLFFTNKKVASTFQIAHNSNRFLFMPNVLARTLPSPFKIEDRRGIFCGGMERLNKNYLNQIAAYAVSKVSEPLFTMGSSRKALYTTLGKTLFGKTWHVFPPVVDHGAYYDQLRQFKLGLQVSVSENFCYLVQELGLLKIPCIVSPMIDWYRGRLLDRYCRVENIEDVLSIAACIRYVWQDEATYKALCEEAYEVSKRFVDINRKRAVEILEVLLKRIERGEV